MKHLPLLLALVVTVLALGLTSCGSDNPSGPPPITLPGDGEPILYSKHIQPIFLNSCSGSGCHIGGDTASGLRLDTWELLMAGSDYGGMVVPFAGTKSHLFQHINTDPALGPRATPQMPLSRDPLPIEQILAIKRWIDEGARNDAGEVPMAGENRPRVFVTAQSEDKVSVIDLQTEFVARYITVGSRPDSSTPPEAPHNIVLSPDGRYFYVNLIAAGMIEKYDAHTFEKIAQTQVGRNPAQIIVTRDGATLYVSNFDQSLLERFILEVDASTMTVTRTIVNDTLKAPHSLALSTDERFLYTTNESGDNVSEIDLGSGQITRSFPMSPGMIPVGKPRYEPYQVLLSPDGKSLWVSCRASEEVRVINIESGQVTDSIPVGDHPLIIGFDPSGRRLWVPNQGSDNVTLVDVDSRSVVATIPDIGLRPHAVAFTSDGKTAFVSCENLGGNDHLHHPLENDSSVPGLVYVIDTSTLAVQRIVEVGSFAAGIVINQ